MSQLIVETVALINCKLNAEYHYNILTKNN